MALFPPLPRRCPIFGRARLRLALLAIAGLAACSDPPIGSPPSDASMQPETSLDATSPVDQGIPLDELPPIDVAAPDKRVIDLSPSELALLCDWNAREYGGYGGSLPCRLDASSPSIGAPIGVQDCVDTLEFQLWGRQCPLTVQDFMECVHWQVQKVCSPTDAGDWPQSCVTQQGPLCIGGIGKDGEVPTADAEAGLDEAGEAGAGDDAASDSAASDSGDGPAGD